jgi:hypothetical protein
MKLNYVSKKVIWFIFISWAYVDHKLISIFEKYSLDWIFILKVIWNAITYDITQMIWWMNNSSPKIMLKWSNVILFENRYFISHQIN